MQSAINFYINFNFTNKLPVVITSWGIAISITTDNCHVVKIIFHDLVEHVYEVHLYIFVMPKHAI